ncbi:putative Nitrate Transporter 1.1 [Zostera marina]|uniref:Putative Nitrate Transporter 1.1 n=1 Tax=Zostera marina TaxID=29655 RepID=A0A0K9PSH9_ZOSMR|nr:putative Nitrate Transporter 1.1 [Zostera marina]
MGSSLPEVDGGKVLSDAWDYKGRPAVRSSTGGWASASTILVVELNERLTSLGIAVNLVTYLTGTMHLGNAVSANAVTNFLGTSFMLCLLGGFIADTFLGRYLTIGIFAAIQATGVTILTISTAIKGLHPPKCTSESGPCVSATGPQLSVLYLALYLTALGTGGLKSSVSGFGSDQFDDTNSSEKGRMVKFFNWFFFFISLGSLFAVTVLVYIQDEVGRRWGYGVIAVSILLGLALFLSGTKRYRFKKLVGSPLTQFAAVIISAWKKKNLALPSDPSLLYDISETSQKNKDRLPHTDQFRLLDHASVKDSVDLVSAPNKWRLNTLTDVEEVKQILSMVPVWATTIFFWTVYAQMTTFSVSQATTMDRHIVSNFEIPPGSLTVFFVASILITVPVYDRAIVPIVRRFTRDPQGLRPLQRIGVGLVLSILSMATAALIEIKRLHVATQDLSTLNQETPVPMTVFYLVPQFFLVGAGETFTYIGQLDFFLRECPKGMKTMSTGLFLSTLSIGFFISSMLVTLVHKITGQGQEGVWLADNLNKGKLYDFYWLLAVLSVINLGFYLLAAKSYVYKDSRTVVVGDSGMSMEHLKEDTSDDAGNRV